MTDWTRGDDPIYNGYRENWQEQLESDERPIANYYDEAYEIIKDIPLARLRELVTADADGRVVMLPCKVGDVVAWDNGAGSVLKLFVKAIYHDGTEARLLLKNAAGKFFDAEPLANHPALRYGAEAESALNSRNEGDLNNVF